MVWLCLLVLVLVSCGQVSGEQLKSEDDTQLSTEAMSSSFLTFSWIEKGYNGIFSPIDVKVDQSAEEIIEQFGEPSIKGNYEGGEFWEYKEATFFISPDTNRSVAIAIDIQTHQISSDEMRRQLGTPDQSEMNEMDGYWMFIYDLDEYHLMFEAESEEGLLSYAWLRKQ
ncbi:DUF4309 domain-containing protein [Alkalihalobacillus sp. MEB130]|nr:DUF4309 domain-containing protein [Alkalihalobacillus sp. MEB130]MDT8859209.1 DUF4309 domain-containing protein [Alkalihalobacillus sp. MEB130]